MAKTAKQLVQAISDKDLKICVEELIDFHYSCILKTGLVREFATELVNNLGFGVANYKLKIAEDMIMTEAATRFTNIPVCSKNK